MRVVSGIQSSGKLHLGNYFGALRQFLKLQNEAECFFFIANLHSLTTIRQGTRLREATTDLVLDYLALGLDPDRVILFRQSDVPFHTELAWYLAALTPMGLLERAHSYKDKIRKGLAADVGLFTYPVLMAADILLYRADQVPVGKDQQQHLEITRDLAIKFNRTYIAGYDPADPEGVKSKNPCGILKLPRALVMKDVDVVPGIDGEKMSKSYGNVIEVFAEETVVKKQIMSIKTDSTPVETPKDPNASSLFVLLQLFASLQEGVELQASFRQGGKGYGYYKNRLLELFHETFREARRRRPKLASEKGYVEDVLKRGAERACDDALALMKEVRHVVGTR
ncbi:tryptophan--tRNA ligase [Pajaroellobacter abortibovis]|uniref:Tryptophan--tRNA ligase n=1 Tax=Pajaroellobacter abortibovis TaxID=1882918 RepID=A0A1L6MW87_9BACT|nr:tryptophan--tRNA ligase [Pajaroellobacter abortibovis]APR99734.1 tryptophan--tRNA ligase [Pajaroellobacter abortibovis]